MYQKVSEFEPLINYSVYEKHCCIESCLIEMIHLFWSSLTAVDFTCFYNIDIINLNLRTPQNKQKNYRRK